jgi:putative transposase
MKYCFIKENRSEFPVVKMCKNLKVSKSGYYDWQGRGKSSGMIAKENLMNKISELFYIKHKQMAGSPVVTQDLHDDPEYKSVHRSRVASLMREMGLKCKIQKKFVVTTDSDHKEWIPENLLNREFNPGQPNICVVGDITYIKVGSHWEYLSIFIDLYSRKVVGWDLSRKLAAESTCSAFRKYLYRCKNPQGVLVHSDRGIQYASEQFRSLLGSVYAVQSMSRKGNCWDNAVAESFFHTLKTRLTYHRKYNTSEELNRDLYWYIEVYYNRIRKHSANNWLTPDEKERKYYELGNVA